jgi:uncharacterized membrane protein
MSTSLYLITMSFFFGTILLIFGMKYFSAAFAARARRANDEAYRALAEKALAAQSDSQASLTAIQADLARLAAGLASVETILKQVE